MKMPVANAREERGDARAVRRTAGVAALVAMAVAAGLFVYGCSTPQRYKVLTFFFDGVPPLEGTSPVPGAEGQPGRPGRPAAEQVEVTYYHAPYAKRDCFGCHERQGSYAAPTVDRLSCRRCHESYFQIEPDDWVHGPVAANLCSRCHEPHKSQYPGLLTAPQPQVCLDCHDPRFIEQDAFHSTLEDKTCSRCHDPHATGNRLLLADSRTYQRRDRVQRVERSAHAPWKSGDCVMCHQAEQSNQLVADVDQVCLSCHEPMRHPAGDVPLHKPIAEGKCVVCHTPHRSTRPHLLRPNAEKTCFQCHKPEEVRTPKHPYVVRGDCVICHAGHSSDAPHFLRPHILEGSLEPVSTLTDRAAGLMSMDDPPQAALLGEPPPAASDEGRRR